VEKKYESEVYASKEGRHILHNLYRTCLIETACPVSEQMVETRFGDTHVTLYGHPEGIPVLVFYGEWAINPLAVRPLVNGLNPDKIRLIVPDPVGQAGFSAETRLSLSKNEYGEWACQVMDGLALPVVTVLGYSFGADIALQLCATSLLRVERLLLVLPSGFVNVPASRTARFVQLAKKGVNVTDEDVKKALAPLLPFPQEELTETVRLLALHAKIEKRRLKRFKKKAFQKLNAPVYVIAEKSDELFPGEKVIKQARKIIPHIGGARLLDSGGGHYTLFNPEANEERTECFAAMSNFILQEE
jgi:pimeloyl-ACP methyl ester carboxylesterase